MVFAMTLCPVCQTSNSPAARQCMNCGADLRQSYTTNPQPEPLSPDPASPVKPALPHLGTLALYVMGAEQPLLIRDTASMTLGRVAPEDSVVPDIDLTPFQAQERGVSRLHARINRTSSGYSLTDLKSTNGTWINENRLPPRQEYAIKNGDMLRLGQLVIFAYFL